MVLLGHPQPIPSKGMTDSTTDTTPVLAGFDAGQTHCRCRLSCWTRGGWHVVGEGTGSGVSHLDASGGEERFREAIRSSLQAAWPHGCQAPLAAAAVGASGVEAGTALQTRAASLLHEVVNLPEGRCVATGDERTALRGAFADQAGIVLISGTGMIVVGRNTLGEEHRCGGWGWRLDGAGSAFDLGHQGLQVSLRMADGRLADGPLRQRLWESLGCRTADALKTLVVQPDHQPADLARLAPLVDEAAAQGDREARRILDRSAFALAEAASAVARQLSLNEPNLCARGGALLNLREFNGAVHQAMQQHLPGARWTQPLGDACDGALALARDCCQLTPH